MNFWCYIIENAYLWYREFYNGFFNFYILVPLWSGVNVAGVLFRDILSNVGLEMDEEGWNDLLKGLVKAWVYIKFQIFRIGL